MLALPTCSGCGGIVAAVAVRVPFAATAPIAVESLCGAYGCKLYLVSVTVAAMKPEVAIRSVFEARGNFVWTDEEAEDPHESYGFDYPFETRGVQ